MIARWFCDICTNEVEDTTIHREFRTQVVLPKAPKDHTQTRAVGIQIMRAIDGAWNAGHICNRCLRLALEDICEQLGEPA